MRICSDLGASGTRVTDRSAVIHQLPNGVAFLDRTEGVDFERTPSTGDRAQDFLNNMDLIIEKTSGESHNAFPARVLVGALANRFADSLIRPSVMQNKSRQKINILNAIIAVAQQTYVNGYDGSPITLYIALPPLEVTSATKEELNRTLSGSYNVLCERLGWEVNLNIAEVKCYPECYMALASFFFEYPSCKKIIQNIEKYGKGYVLGLDIGASTTDIYIIENGIPVEKTGQTFKTGCNVMEMDIANGIRQQFGFDPMYENLEQILQEGRMPMGSGYTDVSHLLIHAKQKFARGITAELQNYFRLINIPLQSVRGIIAFGGGALASGYEDNGKEIITCACVSEYITKELAHIVDNIDVITAPDPRTANLRGLFAKMMADEMAEAAAAKAAQQ